MADTLIDLTTGRFTPKQTAGQVFASTTGCGGLRVTQLEQEGMELSRAGRRFTTAQSGAITGIAPVAAVPTTAAQWTLFNASLTDSYHFESIGMELASGTAAAGQLVMAAYFTLPVQTGFGTNIVAQSMSASPNKVSSVAIKSAVTITTPAAPIWFVVAKNDSANTAVLSVAAINDQLKGKLILPPLTGLALATLSGAGTSPLFYPVCVWSEYAVDLE